METLEKLKTLTLENNQFPIEIIQEILSRLPIKPLLQFQSVSKQWLSLISNHPPFSKLHFTHSLAKNHTALLIFAYDFHTEQRHLLSASLNHHAVTHLLTLHNAPPGEEGPTTEAQHLNGLVLFTSNALESSFAFVINPATRNVFKLPEPPGRACPCSYFFGFHQSRNEHCVLSIRMPFPESENFNISGPIHMTDIIQFIPNAIEFMIYSLSTYSWRKIDVKEEDKLLVEEITGKQWYHDSIPSVCVNSVIHFMLEIQNKILAFDLKTEKFSTIDIPRDMNTMWLDGKGMRNVKSNHPYLININGCLGLVCDDRVVERNKMCFWVLKDYDNLVWVKEKVTFSEPWIDSNKMYPNDSIVGMEKIVFSVQRSSWDGLTVPIYDMKTKVFKNVHFSLGQQFLRSDAMDFFEMRSYVESVWPLKKNEEGRLHEED